MHANQVRILVRRLSDAIGLAPLILTLLALQSTSRAQCPSIGWQGGYRLPGIGAIVNALTPCRNPDGTLSTNQFVAAGTFIFSTDRGQVCRYVARWNGLSWEPLDGGLADNVYALATMPNGDIIAVGGFLNAGTAGGVNNIARWDGSSWSSLGTGLVRSVCHCHDSALAFSVIALPSGDVVVSGDFDLAGSVPVNHIARWNGVEWFAMGAGLDARARTLATLPSGDLIAAGEFTTAGGQPAGNIARWDGSSWSPLGSGLAGAAGTAPVLALAVLPNSDIIAAGNITSAGGQPVSGIARWNGSTWAPMGQGISGGPINALTTVPDAEGGADVIAGGDFTTADGLPALRLARWHGSAWYSVGSGADQQVRALISCAGGQIFAGGWFLQCDNLEVDNIVRGEVAPWPGPTTWSTLGDGLVGAASCMTMLASGDLIVAGGIQIAGGNIAGPIFRWNGPTSPVGHRWSTFATGLTRTVGSGTASVFAIRTAPGDGLFAAGLFSVNGTPVNVAQWDGSTWHALGSATNNIVRALAQPPTGDLFAGGSFTNIGGTLANRIARWNGAAWVPLGSGMNSDIHALTITPGGDLIAAGAFTTAGGTSANRIARWNGSAWSPLGSGFNATVYMLGTLPGGDLVAGGTFTTAGGTSANRIARWNGSQWSPFGTGVSASSGTASVRSMSLLTGGDLVIGGTFSAAGGVSARGVARWNGAAWSSFNGGVFGEASSLATIPGGDLVIAGAFSELQLPDGNYFAGAFAHYSFGGSPIIARQPVPVTTCFAGAASFSATATGSMPLAYRWQSQSAGIWTDIFDGSNAELGPVSGAASSTLSLNHPNAVASGTLLRCLVTNSCATATSDAATLIVCAADFDCDGSADFFDYDAFVTCFEGAYCPPGKTADFDGDGSIDFFDYDAFVVAFETPC